MDLKQNGLFRANPFADNQNNLRHVHPTNPGTVAADEATDVDVVTGAPSAITGVKYTGRSGDSKTLLFDSPVSVDDTKAIRDAIFNQTRKEEVDGIIEVTFSTPNLTIKHWGAGTLTKVLVDGTEAGTFARTSI